MPAHIAMLVVASSCSMISYKTLFGYTNLKKKYKFSLYLLMLISWFMPAIAIIIKYNNPSIFVENIVNHVGFSIFAFVAILFCLHFVRDFTWFIAWGLKKKFDLFQKLKSPEDNYALNKANIYTSYIALFILACGLYSGNKIADIKEINIHTNKVAVQRKIVLLSDIHVKRTDSKSVLEAIVEKVNNQNPDIVVLAGDTIDSKVGEITEQLDALTKLKSQYKIYTVLGNHEAYQGMIASMKYFNSRGEYRLLFNQGENLLGDNIFIGGVNDKAMDEQFKPNIERSLVGSNEDEYKILISHRPDTFKEASEKGYDLVLSGHTHGGQIFPFHFMVKQAMGYVAGLYEENGSKLYISRGVRYWGPAIRLLAPSEITVINLIPNK